MPHTPAKKTSRKKPAGGRPKDRVEKTTISYRVPVVVVGEFQELVDAESAKRMGSDATLSELYNMALGEFLSKRDIHVPGYNAPREKAAS